MNEIRGFKVFNSNWACRGMQYTCPGDFEEDVQLEVCGSGMHFCKQAKDCFNYYGFNPENKVAEVIAYGDILEDGDKCCTNKLRIVREIPWLELLTIVNLGKSCTGFCNTGNRNTGNRNTGDCNTGDWNTGDWNTGDCNTGNRNTGDWNTGDCNTGNRNTGDCNTGDCNTGNRNTGDCNTGDWNTGDWNTGDWNTGDWNQSDFCTGDFNLVDHETGCFCTEIHKIRIFDQETDLTYEQWRNSEACYLLHMIDFRPNEWVWSCDMSDAEKSAHPEHEITGGYLKVNNTDKAFLDWWEKRSISEREIIKAIPNFNAEKFTQITGIKA